MIEREEASQRLAGARDVAAWQATMARLDAEQQVARQPRQHQRMAPDEVVAYLRSLPTLWTDAGPERRQALASALFAKLEVEGYQKMRYELTPDAVELGLSAVLPAVLETGAQMGGFGRGERGSASLAHLRFRPRIRARERHGEPRCCGRSSSGRLADGEPAADSAPARGPPCLHRARVRRSGHPRVGHQRDDGAAAPIRAVPAGGVPERGAGGVLAGHGPIGRPTSSEDSAAAAACGGLRSGRQLRGAVVVVRVGDPDPSVRVQRQPVIEGLSKGHDVPPYGVLSVPLV